MASSEQSAARRRSRASWCATARTTASPSTAPPPAPPAPPAAAAGGDEPSVAPAPAAPCAETSAASMASRAARSSIARASAIAALACCAAAARAACAVRASLAALPAASRGSGGPSRSPGSCRAASPPRCPLLCSGALLCGATGGRACAPRARPASPSSRSMCAGVAEPVEGVPLPCLAEGGEGAINRVGEVGEPLPGAARGGAPRGDCCGARGDCCGARGEPEACFALRASGGGSIDGVERVIAPPATMLSMAPRDCGVCSASRSGHGASGLDWAGAGAGAWGWGWGWGWGCG